MEHKQKIPQVFGGLAGTCMPKTCTMKNGRITTKLTIFTTTYYMVSRGKNFVNNCDPRIVLVPYMVA